MAVPVLPLVVLEPLVEEAAPLLEPPLLELPPVELPLLELPLLDATTQMLDATSHVAPNWQDPSAPQK